MKPLIAAALLLVAAAANATEPRCHSCKDWVQRDDQNALAIAHLTVIAAACSKEINLRAVRLGLDSLHADMTDPGDGAIENHTADVYAVARRQGPKFCQGMRLKYEPVGIFTARR